MNGTTKDDDTVAVGSSDPAGAALATYLGALGLVVPIELVGQWLILVPVLALELGSAMAVVLVHAVGPLQPNDMGRPKGDPAGHEPSRVPIRRSSRVQDRTAELIVDHLMKHGGSMIDSQRAIAKLVGTSKPTVRRALNQLATRQILAMHATKKGTALRLL